MNTPENFVPFKHSLHRQAYPGVLGLVRERNRFHLAIAGNRYEGLLWGQPLAVCGGDEGAIENENVALMNAILKIMNTTPSTEAARPLPHLSKSWAEDPELFLFLASSSKRYTRNEQKNGPKGTVEL